MRCCLNFVAHELQPERHRHKICVAALDKTLFRDLAKIQYVPLCKSEDVVFAKKRGQAIVLDGFAVDGARGANIVPVFAEIRGLWWGCESLRSTLLACIFLWAFFALMS